MVSNKIKLIHNTSVTDTEYYILFHTFFFTKTDFEFTQYTGQDQ